MFLSHRQRGMSLVETLISISMLSASGLMAYKTVGSWQQQVKQTDQGIKSNLSSFSAQALLMSAAKIKRHTDPCFSTHVKSLETNLQKQAKDIGTDIKLISGSLGSELQKMSQGDTQGEVKKIVDFCLSGSTPNMLCFAFKDIENPRIVGVVAATMDLFDFKNNNIFSDSCDKEALLNPNSYSQKYLAVGMRIRSRIAFISEGSAANPLRINDQELFVADSNARVKGEITTAGYQPNPFSTCPRCGDGSLIPAPNPTLDPVGYQNHPFCGASCLRSRYNDKKIEATSDWK